MFNSNLKILKPTIRMQLAPPSGWHKFTLSSSASVSHICTPVFVSRSSRAVLQSDVVPQSGARPHVHSSDRLSQRPLHSAVGQEETVHPGSLYRNTDRSGSVSERFADRWVCVWILCICVNCSGVCQGGRKNKQQQPSVHLHLTSRLVTYVCYLCWTFFFYYWCFSYIFCLRN